MAPPVQGVRVPARTHARLLVRSLPAQQRGHATECREDEPDRRCLECARRKAIALYRRGGRFPCRADNPREGARRAQARHPGRRKGPALPPAPDRRRRPSGDIYQCALVPTWKCSFENKIVRVSRIHKAVSMKVWSACPRDLPAIKPSTLWLTPKLSPG